MRIGSILFSRKTAKARKTRTSWAFFCSRSQRKVSLMIGCACGALTLKRVAKMCFHHYSRKSGDSIVKPPALKQKRDSKDLQSLLSLQQKPSYRFKRYARP